MRGREREGERERERERVCVCVCLLYLWDPDDPIRGIRNSTPGVSGPMAGVSGCYSTAGVRSATPAEATMAPCKLKILSSGGEREAWEGNTGQKQQ